ncbi:SDR family oxidoreductase [Luteimonas saliphila]|uniref:SDR family oxidoreductase n=1 Tax=Luteimonas saliphila TaxID=2804919 RepID=UPI00192D54B3|nr:SDR family oxidoreductase [Luteimonas saliphila]
MNDDTARPGRRLFDLDGRVALITGGSRGLGLQIAEALGDYGATVAISARKQHELDAALAHLRGRGIRAEAFAADVGKPESVSQLVAAVLDAFGQIDILVNNAGASWGADAADYPLEAWDKVFDLNVRGLFLLTQQVAKRSMLPRGSGRIINIASIAGLRGNAGGALRTIAYNASKGAVVNLTRALAAEWGGQGIIVNAIAPGFFPSKMSQGVIDALGEEALMGNAPLRRLGGDEDLKGAALLFASDAGAHITGQVLAVDGGYTAV